MKSSFLWYSNGFGYELRSENPPSTKLSWNHHFGLCFDNRFCLGQLQMIISPITWWIRWSMTYQIKGFLSFLSNATKFASFHVWSKKLWLFHQKMSNKSFLSLWKMIPTDDCSLNDDQSCKAVGRVLGSTLATQILRTYQWAVGGPTCCH